MSLRRKEDAEMTREEMFGLARGELVVVKDSGKVYRVTCVEQPGDPAVNAAIELEMAKQRAEIGTYIGRWPVYGSVTFIQQRNGKDYGALRNLKPENIERAPR